MIRYFNTPYFLRWFYPSLTWKIDGSDSIYLTFDDGPDKEVTSWVLEELEKVDAKATFFCLGRNLIKNEQLVKSMSSKGHLLANHTFDHLNGLKASNQQYLESIEACDVTLKSFRVNNNLLRPPYGKIKRSQIKMLREKKIIMWSHLAYDFDLKLDINKSIEKLKQAPSGSIITFHDSQKAFKNLKLILPDLLLHYQSKELKMETLNHD